MIKITAAIITLNEEDMILDCIDRLSWVDEIIVVDNGSTDKTVEFAKTKGAKVYSLHENNFSKLRNLAIRKSKGEWLLYIDADERVTDGLDKEILREITHSSFAAYNIRRKNFYLGHLWPYVENITRLFKTSELKSWVGILHEAPKVKGNIGNLKGFINHHAHRNLESMVDKTNKWSEVEAELRFSTNHPPMYFWRFARIIVTSFWEYYVRQQGIRAGTAGLIESIYQSFSSFITYAKLWERQTQNENRHI